MERRRGPLDRRQTFREVCRVSVSIVVLLLGTLIAFLTENVVERFVSHVDEHRQVAVTVGGRGLELVAVLVSSHDRDFVERNVFLRLVFKDRSRDSAMAERLNRFGR